MQPRFEGFQAFEESEHHKPHAAWGLLPILSRMPHPSGRGAGSSPSLTMRSPSCLVSVSLSQNGLRVSRKVAKGHPHAADPVITYVTSSLLHLKMTGEAIRKSAQPTSGVAVWRLDLEHPGPQLCKHQRCRGPLLVAGKVQNRDAVQGSADRHFKRTFRGASKTPWPVQKLELPLFLHDAHEVVLNGELVESNC